MPSTHFVQARATFSIPDLPKGINMDLWQRMSQVAQASLDFGYDPTNDFHRRGSHTHSDYQHQGHMRRLTQFCNTIADATRSKTYATCREAAVPLFLSEGYKVVGIQNFETENWNRLSRHDANHYALMREPKAMLVDINKA